MGFDTEKFFQWIKNRGWISYDFEFDDFIKAANPTTFSILVKAYEDAIKKDSELREANNKVSMWCGNPDNQ